MMYFDPLCLDAMRDALRELPRQKLHGLTSQQTEDRFLLPPHRPPLPTLQRTNRRSAARGGTRGRAKRVHVYPGRGPLVGSLERGQR